MTATQVLSGAERTAEIHRLAEQLREADERLDLLLGSDADSVTAGNGKTFLLQRAQQRRGINLAESLSGEIFDALPANGVLLDAQGIIVGVNAAWRQYALNNALQNSDYALGTSYLQVCDIAANAGSEVAAQVARGLRELLAGASRSFELEYPCHSPEEKSWYLLRAVTLGDGPSLRVLVVHFDITQRVSATHEVEKMALATKARERMFHLALSAISDFTYIVDARERLMFANQGVLDLWGVTLEQALGKNAFDLGYPAESAQKIHAQLRSVFASGKAVSDEMAYDSPVGGEGWYAYKFDPALSEDGSVDFVVGCSTDVTQWKRAQLALQESVSEFRTLAAAIPQIVFIATPQGELTYLSQKWIDYTGSELAAGLGYGWWKVIHPDDRERVVQAFDRAEDGDHSYEARLRRDDGTYRWWLVRAVAMKDETGMVVKLIGTCTDIDDLRVAEINVTRANGELKQQRAELRLVLDLLPAMIWLRDPQGKILRVNERAARSVGRTVAELEGMSINQVYSVEAAAQYRATDAQIIRTGQPLLGVIESRLEPDGQESWTQLDKLPFRDEAGDVAGMVIMRTDVTDRKRDQIALRELNIELEQRVRRRTLELDLAREDAERANQAKSDFLAMMSHEIRTPMSGLLGMLELHSLSLDEVQKSNLAVARSSGEALMRIIDDILDFSKIEANSLDLNVAVGSIRSVVSNVCRLHMHVASSKNLLLGCDISPEISPFLLFDALRVGQILNNFINNAIKFTSNGRVDVSVVVVEGHGNLQRLRFAVRDTGIGMTPAQVGRVFQPFVQATAETSAKFGGTGLGLSISKRVAELMGGTVDVESEVGVGTTLSFTAAFEIFDAPEASDLDADGTVAGSDPLEAIMAGRRPAPSVEDARADGSLLLIVDDHPTNRAVMAWQAASLGYAAVVVDDGSQALQAYESDRFAAVITDCNMPVMDGYELARAIRRNEQEGGKGPVPIIACTANALPATADFCFKAGMDECLVKPVDLASLALILDRLAPLARFDHPDRHSSRSLPENSYDGVLDLGLIAEVSGGDEIAQAEILLEFQRVNNADAAALSEAVHSRDFEKIKRFAHRIRGSSQMLGASLLCRICSELEAACSERDTAAVNSLMLDFDTELLRLNRCLAMFPTASR